LEECIVECVNAGGDPATCEAKCFSELVSTQIIPLIYNEPCQAELVQAKAALLNSYNRLGPDIYFNIVFNSLTADLRSVLPSINIATLFVTGTNDEIVHPAPALAEYMASLIPPPNVTNALDFLRFTYFANFIGKGHVPFITDYCTFGRLIKRFAGNRQYACASVTFSDTPCCVCPLLTPTDFAAQACADILNLCLAEPTST
jgi:hypothetical protein